FVTLDGRGLADLVPGSKVGTSSLRRKAQLILRQPGLEVVEFRGNVQTRMAKLRDGVAHATFLAMAGLNRLGLADVPRTAMDADAMLPAIAQGAIGIERRADNHRMADILAMIHDRDTGLRVEAERAFLRTLDGSCETPIAGLAVLDGGTLRLRGEILRPDGSDVLEEAGEAPAEDGAALGDALARKLLERAPDGFFDWRETVS
ncbi:MAG: hydroxymethylbilane synthase, partial [Pseudomonadota bacterium]